jgi:hypothetical protein
MKTTKEDLLIIRSLDGNEEGREIVNNRTIYHKADGSEWINWIRGKRRISRDANGQAVFQDTAKTVHGMNGLEFLEMVKKRAEETGATGVTIVTLSENGVSDASR